MRCRITYGWMVIAGGWATSGGAAACVAVCTSSKIVDAYVIFAVDESVPAAYRMRRHRICFAGAWFPERCTTCTTCTTWVRRTDEKKTKSNVFDVG